MRNANVRNRLNFRTICIKYIHYRVSLELHNFVFANLLRNIPLVIFTFAFTTSTIFFWVEELEVVQPFWSLVHTLFWKIQVLNIIQPGQQVLVFLPVKG